MASIEAHIIELKTLRRDIDSLITRIKGMSASRETQLAVQHLEDAGMRLGRELGRIRDETIEGEHPYPNSKDPNNTIIDPPAYRAAGPSEHGATIAQLHGALSTLTSHVQAQTETISRLRTQVAHQIELVAKLADGGKVAEILDLEKQVDEANQRLLTAEGRANELQGQLNDLSRLAEDRAFEIAGLKVLQRQVNDLNRANQEAVDLANARATEIAKMSRRIHALCDENADLRKQLEECNRFADERINLANMQTEKCARLHDESAQLRVELEAHKNELLRRQGVLDAFKASHDNFKSRAQNSEEKVKVLQSQLNSTIDQFQGQRVTISDLDAKCMVLNKEMGDLVKQRDQLASVLNQITNQLRDSECKGQKLAKECDERLKKIKELNAQIECLNRDAQALRSRNVAFASSAGWQPIETAPKDGTYILIRQRSDDSPVGFNAYVCKHDATFPHLPWTTSYGMILGTNPNAPVTHWMPLPPAPGSPGPAAGSSHSEAVARLIAAFESALMIKPHLWFEIGYTSPTDWMVHIWDKSRSQSEGQKIIETQGPIEAACNHARAKLEDYIFKPAS